MSARTAIAGLLLAALPAFAVTGDHGSADTRAGFIEDANGAKVRGAMQVSVDGTPWYIDGAIANITPMSVLLSTSGGTTTPSAATNLNVNGSSSAVTLYLEAAADTLVVVESLRLIYEDNATFASNTFGAVASLTNGVLIRTHDGTDPLVNIANVTNNVTVESAGASLNIHSYSGTDITGVATFYFRGSGGPVVLRAGEQLQVVVRDNLTGLGYGFVTACYRVVPLD